jgi:Na+-transporting NADH:ubiquinone oxidoreductase subunit NqrD
MTLLIFIMGMVATALVGLFVTASLVMMRSESLALDNDLS